MSINNKQRTSSTAFLNRFQRVRRLYPAYKYMSGFAVLISLWRFARSARQPVHTVLQTLDARTTQRLNHSHLTNNKPGWQTIAEVQRQQFPNTRVRVVTVPEYVNAAAVDSLHNTLAKLEDDTWLLFATATDQFPKGFLQQLEQQSAGWPDAAVITLDEWTVEGDTLQPLCKPEWDETMLWARPYLGRGVLLRKKEFIELGGVQLHQGPELIDAALDDWLLRWSTQPAARKRTQRLTGLPLIRQSTVPWGVSEQRTARTQALLGAWEPGCVVSVRPEATNTLYVQWPLPAPAPRVSLIIPTRNGLEVLKPCVEHLLGQTNYPCFELIVVDNDSDCPNTLAYLKALPDRDARVRVMQWPGAFNYAAINNAAVKQARGAWVCLLNNDVEPTHPQWLTEMMRLAVRPEVGCVGAKLLYPDGRIQHAGVVLGVGGVAGHSHRFAAGGAAGYMNRLQVPQRYSAVTGACLLVNKALYEQVGGLDARAFPINYNDIDLCLKLIEAGYINLWTPDAVLTHHESLTRGRGARGVKRWKALAEARRFKRKWRHFIESDPAYHPDLTPFTEGFELNPLRFAPTDNQAIDPMVDRFSPGS